MWSNSLKFFVWILIGIIGFIFLAFELISSGSFPSFDQYIASSTPEVASSIPEVASSTSLVSTNNKTSIIKTSKSIIKVTIADTLEAQDRGLGGRDSLPIDEGMLFVFPQAGTYGFWMKDMNFSLDIIWIDENFRVVDISKNISPETFPKIFTSTSPIKYVLEINAGEAEKNDIKSGTELNFSALTSK